MTDLLTDKDRVCEEIDGLAAELVELSQRIHGRPELAFEERSASRWFSEVLEREGFDTELGVAGMATAFRGTYRGAADRPRIALLGEYDALPKIGHACGHNLIGVASLGAAVALKRAVPDLPGTVVMLGTPAEEGGGGKVIMVDNGVFDDVDAAMMFHPSSKNYFVRGGLASAKLKMSFYGKPAHAASVPEKGINALDALIQTFVAINSLRQHVRSDVRIHGIITHGGDAPNVVPAYAEGRFIVRADTRANLEKVKDRVINCARGAALQTGARVEFEEGITYAERNNNVTMAGLFGENLKRFGVESDEPPTLGGVGSSDIGNVSIKVPAIHPYLQICGSDVAGHTPEFAVAAQSEAGYRAMLLAAKGLAMTTLDLMGNLDALAQVRSEFQASRQGN